MVLIQNIKSSHGYVELGDMDTAEMIQEPNKKTSKASQIVHAIHKIASAILLCCLPNVDETMSSGYFGECSNLYLYQRPIKFE